MNIIFAVDDQVAKDAAEVAQKVGKTIEQVIQEYIERLGAIDQPE